MTGRSPQTRVLLWSSPRSVSTAFEHSVCSLPQVKGFHEPYSSAFYLGEEKRSPRYRDAEPLTGFRYAQVRERLEAQYPEAQALFVKDMAYAFERDLSLLPAGYTHSFLIRDPRHSVTSLHRILSGGNVPEWREFIELEISLEDLRWLFQVRRDCGEKPALVVADDLLRSPESIMAQYCEAVGLEYDPSMLSWEAPLSDERSVVWQGDWYETLASSGGFDGRVTERTPDLDSLPSEVRRAIDANLPIYEELREYRIRP